MMSVLQVFREVDGTAQLIGFIKEAAGEAGFFYDETYAEDSAAVAVSSSLPLAGGGLAPAFFEGLLPEGARRGLYASALHLDSSDWISVLDGLNSDSVGALLVSSGNGCSIEVGQDGEDVSDDLLASFSLRPQKTAFELGMATRLSLAGAQSKLGLRNTTGSWESGWQTPVGFSASTHILKTDDGTFPSQTINEALCLSAAAACGLDVAESKVISPGGKPILVVRRFDRAVLGDSRQVRRLHQEDFCQARGFWSTMKYEPTDGHYANLGAMLIAKASSNPFGDRVAFFESLVFDYLIGNCDNHLKNKSFLWSTDWKGRSFAPLYDLTCTTIYPGLDTTMGIGLSPEREISSVTFDSILATAGNVGVPKTIAAGIVRDLQKKLPDALSDAASRLAREGYDGARAIADEIIGNAAPRCGLR